MSLPEFKLLRPRTMAEAIDFLAKHAAGVGVDDSPAQSAQISIRVLAGGTDLIPSMRQKLFEPKYVLDLRGNTSMRGIRPKGDGGVEIGALTTLRAIERSDFLRQHYPVLTEAAATVASPVLRTMG